MSRATPNRTGSDGMPSARTLSFRHRCLLGAWLLAAAVLLARAVELQVVQGSEWRAEADRQHRAQGGIAAERGSILDRDGLPLAVSHEAFRIGVAPHELVDPGVAARVLAEALDLTPAEAERITRDERRWVMVPGRFPASVRESLLPVRGVYVERELRRFYPHDALIRSLLGVVIDEEGAGGIEQEFEEHLRGVPGQEIVARDSEGRPIPGATWTVSPPRSGGSVVLTLDAALQEIAYEALQQAVDTHQARGGDLIVTDPRTGEVLAMVSLRDGATTHLGGINTPYEPGSTLKPFTVATLMREGRATLSDLVDTGQGSWFVNGREIRDVSPAGIVSLGEALQVSSNIGIAKLAERLTPGQQYEALRDFGFGVPTGIQLPGEVGGTLRRPAQWSRQSSASLAMGYEISVTPIQMAMAYGALANGGVLMEPQLIRELRDADGRPVTTFEPRAVRRVIPENVAFEINRTLVGAVETGTGTQARLASFAVAGKSGTARIHGPGGYVEGAYFSSFVGFFPAEDPQLVVFVKLEQPRGGAYYGGAIAAPVTRATMEAILAARRPPLDRGALAAIARAQGAVQGRESGGVTPPTGVPGLAASGLDAVIPAAQVATVASAARAPDPVPSFVGTPDLVRGEGALAVPDLRGVAARTAARRLHGMGLTVLWEAPGPIGGTIPAAGSPVLPGDTVRLVSGAAPPGTLAAREAPQ